MTEQGKAWAMTKAGKKWPSPHIDEQAIYWVETFYKDCRTRALVILQEAADVPNGVRDYHVALGIAVYEVHRDLCGEK